MSLIHVKEPAVIDELHFIQTEYDITVEELAVQRAGFAGHTQLIVILKFVIAGIATGLLKKIGEDVWGRLRSAASLLFKKNNATLIYEVVFEVRIGDSVNYTSFICKTKCENDLGSIRAFQQRLLIELERGPNATWTRREYHLSSDGSWKE